MDDFFTAAHKRLERSSAGSGETARKVMSMIKTEPKTALFFGDDALTPQIISGTGASVLAVFGEDFRAESAKALGFDSRKINAFEEALDGERDLIWYNGIVEISGIPRRLEQIREHIAQGGSAVFRTLCRLIDLSPDTESYINTLYGTIPPLDEVVREAKQAGFVIDDFYIAPKNDWRKGYYQPLKEIAEEYQSNLREKIDGEQSARLSELDKQIYMFELHCEEYSFVYYILRKK